MPVVEPTPHARKRALVRRGTLHSLSSDDENPKSPLASSPIQKLSGSISPLTRSFSSSENLKGADRSNSLIDDDVHVKVDSEIFQGRPKAYTLPPGLLRNQLNWVNSQQEESSDNLSDRRSSSGSTGSDMEPRRLSSICPPDLSTISEAREIEQTSTDTPSHAPEAHEDDISTPTVKKNSSSLDKINNFRSGRQYSIYNKYCNPDLDYDLEEYETIAPSMLQEVLLWDFSIDQLENDSNGFILSRVSYLVCLPVYCNWMHFYRWHTAFFMKLV